MFVFTFDEDVMDRIVIISDVSNEFPKNTSSSFKVRVPRVLRYDGEWEVALTSISMPDQGLDVNQMSDKRITPSDIIVKHSYRVDYTNNPSTHITKKDKNSEVKDR